MQSSGRPAARPSFTEDWPQCVRKSRTAGCARTVRCGTNSSTRSCCASHGRQLCSSSGCCFAGRLQSTRQPWPSSAKASRSVPTAAAVRKPLLSVPRATYSTRSRCSSASCSHSARSPSRLWPASDRQGPTTCTRGGTDGSFSSSGSQKTSVCGAKPSPGRWPSAPSPMVTFGPSAIPSSCLPLSSLPRGSCSFMNLPSLRD
mmetsp:Transcript_51217/g.163992  ORF Transcript_51217/g.163992 Transcript_51217/m.163992 type:complete len:202 (+) Transcript_51217:409-1014(+)